MKVSIVVPCYNEEENILEFYDEVVDLLVGKIDNVELVFVNDGSKDKTQDELRKIVKYKVCDIKVVSFSRNFGKEAAMYAGLENTTGDYVAIIDADLQQDPKLILDMLDVLEENEEYDSVAMYQAKRKERKIMTFFKSSFYKLINSVSETEIRSNASDFRLLKRSVVDAILSLSEGERFSKGIFSWVGFNTYYMSYDVKERAHGESKWSFLKLLKYAISGILSFTVAPLRLSMLVGGVTEVSSILYLVYCLMGKGTNKYDILITLILFICGLQFMCMGIMGEYIGRIYMASKNRPVYIAKDIVSNKKVDVPQELKISKKKIS